MPISGLADISGCKFWGDAGQLSLSDNDPAPTWTDFSGQGNHATSSGGNRAAFKTGIINGLPVLRFDGADDGYAFPDFCSGFTAGTVFLVLKLDADPPPADGKCGLWHLGTTASATVCPYTDGTIYDGFGTDSRKSTVNPTPSLAAAFRIYEVVSAPSDWRSYLDTVGLYSTATNTVGFPNNPRFGGSQDGVYNLDGDVAELAIFNSALSGTDRQRAQFYLDQKYALGLGVTDPDAGGGGGVFGQRHYYARRRNGGRAA